jgi:cardiolipin synthase
VTGRRRRRPSKAAIMAFWGRYRWWERATFLIGIASFIGVIVILFLPIGKGPVQYAPTAPLPAAGSPAFLQALSTTMAIPQAQGARPEILVNGDAFLARFLGDIDAAQHSITMMNYIWSDGRFSDQILVHLERKVAKGVQVRILLDDYGSVKSPRGKFDHFKSLGGKVATFRSLMPLPWTIMRNAKRNHRRALTIDGRIAYTGGVAVDDKWLGDARSPDEWHDIMLRFTGSVAARLQGSFAEVWMASTGEMLAGENYYPQGSAGDTDMSYVTLSSSPSPDLYEMQTFLLASIWSARRSIQLETPYFLPDASVRRALEDKARAGVAVTLLLPGAHTDEKSVRWAGQRVFDELMSAGVKIYEYQPTFTHTKFLVEDGMWSVVGSANWDNRSRKLNDEVVVGVADPQLAASLQQVFRADLTRSRPITLQEWRRRGPLQRVLEWVSQTFVQQY